MRFFEVAVPGEAFVMREATVYPTFSLLFNGIDIARASGGVEVRSCIGEGLYCAVSIRNRNQDLQMS